LEFDAESEQGEPEVEDTTVEVEEKVEQDRPETETQDKVETPVGEKEEKAKVEEEEEDDGADEDTKAARKKISCDVTKRDIKEIMDDLRKQREAKLRKRGAKQDWMEALLQYQGKLTKKEKDAINLAKEEEEKKKEVVEGEEQAKEEEQAEAKKEAVAVKLGDWSLIKLGKCSEEEVVQIGK